MVAWKLEGPSAEDVVLAVGDLCALIGIDLDTLGTGVLNYMVALLLMLRLLMRHFRPSQHLLPHSLLPPSLPLQVLHFMALHLLRPRLLIQEPRIIWLDLSTRMTIGVGFECGGLYFLCQGELSTDSIFAPSSSFVSASSTLESRKASAALWHARLGHVFFQTSCFFSSCI
ncbi:uncharacterized protein LOC131227756 [Magnolia sinica]|uniref:uncharacterized protein LOC131227756 n=1 Tax=Magnolia sinica TaxID=86752 RepID=UPI002658483E|nr:uncharacterized protein LOC131227756 [Magnolia sinica]